MPAVGMIAAVLGILLYSLRAVGSVYATVISVIMLVGWVTAMAFWMSCDMPYRFDKRIPTGKVFLGYGFAPYEAELNR
jgi:hypothetical protein